MELRDTNSIVRLVSADLSNYDLLWNLNQKYLYEMTYFYDNELDDSGNLHYGHFEEYFSDPQRQAFLIYKDSKLAGFAMINPYSNINGSPDYVMAEFTVFPVYRRQNIATRAAKLLFENCRGKWEIKYNEKNDKAKQFWTKITADYMPEKTKISKNETVLSFSSAIV